MNKFLNLKGYNFNKDNLNLLELYYPSIKWECWDEEVSLELGRFYYIGYLDLWKLNLHCSYDWADFTIWITSLEGTELAFTGSILLSQNSIEDLIIKSINKLKLIKNNIHQIV